MKIRNNLDGVFKLFIGFCLVVQALAVVTAASAQTVFTFGADEYYDNNIFLEDDNGVPAPVIVDSQLGQPEGNLKIPDQYDGDPNDAYITNVFVGASGAVPLSQSLVTTAAGRVGGIFVGDYSDQDRVTLDTNLSISPEQGLLPEPLNFSITDTIRSQGGNIGTANGTATQQTQTHQVGLNLGAGNMRIADKTTASLAYSFNYSQFLGAFLLDGQNDEDLGPYANQNDQNSSDGSDFITNGIDGSINRNITQSWVAGLFAGVTQFTYTRVGSNVGDEDASDLDRLDARTGIRSSYQLNEKFFINSSVGVLRTSLSNSPDQQTATVVDGDGNITEVNTTPESDQTNLIFSGGFTYIPVPSFTLITSADQFSGPDTNGNRITTRSFSVDAIKTFGDRTRAGATGRFLQFSGGDDLSGATDRYEVSTFVGYNLLQNLEIHAGWNWGIQNADDNNVAQQVQFGNGDYEFNRFFIGLTTGFVGSKS